MHQRKFQSIEPKLVSRPKEYGRNEELDRFTQVEDVRRDFGHCVFAIIDTAASTNFYLNKTAEGFTWMSLVALFEKHLAFFVDLIAFQSYATKLLKSEAR